MDCDAVCKCWEFYGEHQRSFVSAQQIEDKLYTLTELARTISIAPTVEEIKSLQTSCRDYLDILSERWRNCVREPFNFPKPKREDGMSLLLELGLVKPAEPITRRL